MNEKTISRTKKIVRLIVTIGASKIVHSIIKNNIEPENPFQEVTIGAASLALGGAVGEIAGTYTDRQIDEIIDVFAQMREKLQNR